MPVKKKVKVINPHSNALANITQCLICNGIVCNLLSETQHHYLTWLFIGWHLVLQSLLLVQIVPFQRENEQKCNSNGDTLGERKNVTFQTFPLDFFVTFLFCQQFWSTFEKITMYCPYKWFIGQIFLFLHGNNKNLSTGTSIINIL